MNRLTMKVYRKDYENGQPWKSWCVAEVDGQLLVRFAGYAKLLQERVLEKQTIMSAIGAKEKEGYKYVGTHWVTTVIEDEANSSNATPQEIATAEVMPQSGQAFKIPPKLSWKASNLPRNWIETAESALANLTPELQWEIELQGHKDCLMLIAGTARVGIAIDQTGNGRGTLRLEGGDFIFQIALLALGKALKFDISDNKGDLVQVQRLRANHELLKSDELNADQVNNLATRSNLVLSEEKRKLQGAASFF